MGAQQQGADAISGRWLTIPRTLSFVFNGEDVLLMKRGAHKRVFPNQYNGLGGHIERNEDPLTGALREIREESGLLVRDIRLRGIHHIDSGHTNGIMLFAFTAYSDSREFVDDSDEGSLHWVPLARLSDYDLVEDLPLILPRLATPSGDKSPYFVHISYDDQDVIQMRFAGE